MANTMEEIQAYVHPVFSKIILNIGVPMANPTAKNNCIIPSIAP